MVILRKGFHVVVGNDYRNEKTRNGETMYIYKRHKKERKKDRYKDENDLGGMNNLNIIN